MKAKQTVRVCNNLQTTSMKFGTNEYMKQMKNKIFKAEVNRDTGRAYIYNKKRDLSYVFSIKDIVILDDENFPPVKNIKVKLDLELLDV